MAVVLTGCKDPEPSPEPTPEPTPELTFEVNIDDVTTSTVVYSVTPSDQQADYLVVLVPETYIDANGIGSGLISKIMDELRSNAGKAGKTMDEFMAEIMSRGTMSKQEMAGLVQNTDYSLVVFGVDTQASYAATTDPLCVPFTTESIAMSDCTFEVVPTVGVNDAELAVYPSDKEINWHMVLVSPAMFDTYTNPEGEYKMSVMDFFTAYMYDTVQQYLNAGYSMDVIIENLIPTGDKVMKAANLTANTSYLYMVAAVVIDGGNMYVVSEPQYDTFTTEEAGASTLTFDIEVGNVEQLRADIKITPSNLEEKFTWAVGVYDGTSTDEELMNAWVNMNKMWFDYGMMLYTGVQDYTAAGPNYKYKVDHPDTDHYVMAFGYNGGVTTAPAVVKFRTLPAPKPEDATFELSASMITGYGFTVNVAPSDGTTNYFFGTCPTGTFNEQATIDEIIAMLEEAVQMNQMFNPNTTIGDVLSSYAWKGEYDIDSVPCEPNTTYDAYIIAMNGDGSVAKVHLYSEFVTTKNIGEVKPTIEIIGYYSGDEEAGQVFGDSEATAGRAIVVLKLGNLENATTAYLYLGGDIALMNTESRPDNDCYMNLWWEARDVTNPYIFTTADWTSEAYALAYALDASGLPGEIARLAYTATPEAKGDINELFELVESLNAAQAPRKIYSPLKENVTPVEMGTVLNKQTATSKFVGKAVVENNIPETIARPEMEEHRMEIALRTLNSLQYVRTK